MTPFAKRQAGVAAGMAAGLVLTLAAIMWPDLPQVPAATDVRIALWFACSLSVAFWLVVAVGRLAGHRFLTPADIDGGLSANSPRAALLQALIQNTLEQAVLAIVAYGAWLWLGPPERAALVVVFALYFAVGRLLFFVGYARGAPFRALGFTLSFYPTIALFVLLLPEALSALAAGF
ncbi:MAPEG family protein [Allosphingosinicella sp.]|jgi:hypothetical protein|uniref:MAPEG family protein n=1 Tax=Allosphingosinicella sp. TaxID=2823234 RepID=UPI002EE193F3